MAGVRAAGRGRFGARVAVWKEVTADVETPVSAYLKIRQPPHGFLFESVEGGERVGRYSFLGSGPTAIFTAKGRLLVESRNGRIVRHRGDPLAILQRRFGRPCAPRRSFPRFAGGLVGFAGYDAVRHLERLPRPPRDDRGLPDLFFMLQETVLVFDHVRHTITVVAHADRKEGYAAAAAAVDRVVARLERPAPAAEPLALAGAGRPRFAANMTRARFLANVRRAKRYIRAGDIIQTVLSQRFSVPFSRDPLTLYRALRALNPSPYMFLIEGEGIALAGSSPEMLVRLDGREVETRPIAGTRPRGRTAAEDQRLERELLRDPKERAEHVMLVDLGRNDLGRVCRFGSVRVTDSMTVERYSHVMHLVSGVKGTLARGRNAFDVLRSCFPAGTVSGAPKVRAMEIIDELEPTRRGPYAGAAGYLSFTGNMDTAIAIRTIVVTGGRAYLQAGMGIVADSVPAREYQESLAKARHAMLAVAAAGGGS